MPVYLPQINTNLIITQYPYKASSNYDNVKEDLETGMRWAYARRGAIGPGSDYSSLPLGRFVLNYPNITDAEVSTLLTFFRSMCGRYGAFRFLDPGGNLLQYSENFSVSYWNKVTATVGSAATDPFGGNLATTITGTSSNSGILALIGPSDGGLNGYVMNVSVWVRAHSPGQSVFVGFQDSNSLGYVGNVVPISTSWQRISATAVLWTNYYFNALLGGGYTWGTTSIDVYGFQCVPMKGEGTYVRTAGAVTGYHQYCRFDTDVFQRDCGGPDQNSLVLPVVEFNI